MSASLQISLALSVWLLCGHLVFNRSAVSHKFTKESSIPLRGLLALLVVVGHLEVIFPYDWHHFAVSVFLFMSGYGTMKSFSERSGYTKGYVLRVTRKLLMPMMIVMAFVLACAIFKSDGSWRFLLAGYIHGQTMLCPHSWYIILSYWLSLSFLLATLRYCNRRLVVSMFAAAIATFVFLKYGLKWSVHWWLSVLVYPVGMIVAYNERKINEIFFKSKSPLLLLQILLLCILGCLAKTLDGNWWSIALQILFAFSVYVCSVLMPIPEKAIPLTWIGGFSLELYLVHGVVRNMSVWRLVSMGCARLSAALISVCLCIAVAFCFHFFLRKLSVGVRVLPDSSKHKCITL